MGDGCIFTRMLEQGTATLGGVLAPYLGSVLARERGAYITQALLDGQGDPLTTAASLLPELPSARRRAAAARVAHAWMALTAFASP
jgi:hypothetical protein